VMPLLRLLDRVRPLNTSALGVVPRRLGGRVQPATPVDASARVIPPAGVATPPNNKTTAAPAATGRRS